MIDLLKTSKYATDRKHIENYRMLMLSYVSSRHNF